MALTFEWDDTKARRNLARHGVSFEEAATVFRDTLSRTIPDPIHSWEEERYVTVGRPVRGRLLVVVHTEQDDTIRVISARRATPRERSGYEEAD